MKALLFAVLVAADAGAAASRTDLYAVRMTDNASARVAAFDTEAFCDRVATILTAYAAAPPVEPIRFECRAVNLTKS